MTNRRTFVLLAFVLAACGSDSATAPTTFVGTWSLQTVNGAALPFTIAQSGTDKAEILGDTITISSTSSYIESTTVRTTLSGAVSTLTVADTGAYVVSGSTVTLTSNSDGSSGSGMWSGNTLTATIQGFSFVYKR